MQTGAVGQGKGNDYGLVSDGMGFEDSPDAEWISSGINSKGPHGLAIGRQANHLQWGFYAAPDRMTPSAQRAFLNALVWMRQFDGHRPLVEREARSRQWVPFYIDYLRKDDVSDSLRSYVKGQFPAGVVDRVGLDPAALTTWFEAARGYLYQQGRSWRIDADLEAIGVANDDPALLDWITGTLGESPGDERALRIARRYLGAASAGDAGRAVAWIREHRDRLFFSDVGGYRWFVDTRERGR